MNSSLVRTVAPTDTPVSLADVKTRLKIDHNDEDSLLLAYIKAATKYAEETTWSTLVSATYVERWDCFPCVIVPKQCPLVSVTTLQYVDTAGTTQTLVAGTDYTVDAYQKPARIIPAFNKSWPATRGYANDVVLTYVAGYGTPADVPEEVKLAIILKVDQQRSSCDDTEKMNGAIDSLLALRSFKVFY